VWGSMINDSMMIMRMVMRPKFVRDRKSIYSELVWFCTRLLADTYNNRTIAVVSTILEGTSALLVSLKVVHPTCLFGDDSTLVSNIMHHAQDMKQSSTNGIKVGCEGWTL
jgi:hypothetical protein